MRENIGLAFQGIWGHKMRSVLTMLGGHVPARMASKKDAVEALRSE